MCGRLVLILAAIKGGACHLIGRDYVESRLSRMACMSLGVVRVPVLRVDVERLI